jgi:hypothetical protein
LLLTCIVLILAAASVVVGWQLVKKRSRTVAASNTVTQTDLAAPLAPVATPLVDPADAGAASTKTDAINKKAGTTPTPKGAAASRPTSPPGAESGFHRITISSHPPTVLFLAGKRLGPIPQQVEIPEGAADPLPLRFLNLARGIRVTRELDPATKRQLIKFLFTKGQLAFDLPEEAEVELDGKALGPNPSTVQVFEGRHKVVVRREGKRRRVKWVEVESGKTARVKLRW